MEDSNNVNKSNLSIPRFDSFLFDLAILVRRFVPETRPLPFLSLATARFLRTLNPVADCDPTRNDRNSQITLRARSLNK